MKPRRPNSFDGAVHRISGLLTKAGAAEAVGKSESLIHQWGDGDNEALPNVKHALALDAAYAAETGGETPILALYGDLLAGMIGHHTRHDPADPLERVTSAAKEAAEAMDEYRAFLQGCISENSATAALSEIHEAIAAFRMMARDIEARCPGNVSPMVAGAAK